MAYDVQMREWDILQCGGEKHNSMQKRRCVVWKTRVVYGHRIYSRNNSVELPRDEGCINDDGGDGDIRFPINILKEQPKNFKVE